MIRDARGGHNRRIVNENFFKTWTPKMAYVLGFMFADGAIINSNVSSRTYYLCFCNNDLKILEQIRKAIDSDHVIYYKKPQARLFKNGVYPCKAGYILRIGNKIMYSDLIALGLQHRKSNIMTMPDVPDKYFHYFLRGYFDGDGCINLYKTPNRNIARISFLCTSGSLTFLEQLREKLTKVIEIKQIGIQKSDGAYNLVVRSGKAVKIFQYIYKNLYSAPYLSRKYDKFIHFMNDLIGPRVRKEIGFN